MTALDTYDLVVIGAGSGGLATALRAARLGAKVALLDPGAPGGTCVNRGCVPKKVMWSAAQWLHGLSRARALGIGLPETVPLDWPTLVAARDAYIERIHASYRRQFQDTGVQVIASRGTLDGPGRVRLDDGRTLTSAHVVIATGARPRDSTIAGAQWIQDSDAFFGWSSLPASVAIIGGGYIGVELAGLLNALGSRVSLLVRGDHLLAGFDAELAAALAQRMQADGVDVRFGVEVTAVEGGPGALRLRGSGDMTDAEFAAVIGATGRIPNSDGLGLDRAGVALDRRGHILTDADTLATSVPGIWAVGDVTAQLALTPVAVAQGRRLAEQLFGDPAQPGIDFEQVPSVVFSHPPLGKVGMDEATARERFEQVQVYRSRFKPMAESIARGHAYSQFKVVCAGPEQRVVGIHLLGDDVDEILQGFAVALTAGATLEHFRRTLPIHPTAAEEVVLVR